MSTEDAIADAERQRDFARPNPRPFISDFYPGGGADGPTEFSYGPGLAPPGKERATPADGGRYRGTTPRRGRPTARDYDAPGNPGVQAAP